jgi:hypothetical protein
MQREYCSVLFSAMYMDKENRKAARFALIMSAGSGTQPVLVPFSGRSMPHMGASLSRTDHLSLSSNSSSRVRHL